MNPYKTFKGTVSEYRMLHLWVEKKLGKPKLCTKCGEDSPLRRYDWANISGKYLKNTSDWVRLCHLCHNQMDFRKRVCKNGHEMTEENTIVRSIKTGSLHRICRECKNTYNRKYRNSYKEEINIKRRR